MALILHAAWSDDHLHVWAESLDRWLMLAETDTADDTSETRVDMLPLHPHASSHEDVLAALDGCALRVSMSELRLRMPRDLLGPHPSDQLVAVTGTLSRGEAPWLSRFRVPTYAFGAADAVGFLLAVSSGEWGGHLELGYDLRFWSDVARLVADRCEDQRFIPTLRQDQQGRLRARWRPWLQDDEAAERLTRLLNAMPPVARAVDDPLDDAAWPRLEAALEGMTDGVVRALLSRESFGEAIEGRSAADPHVQWLSGLLTETNLLELQGDDAVALLRGARSWIARLDDVAEGQSLRLRLDIQPPPEDHGIWEVTLGLASVLDATEAVTAEAVWRSDPEVLQLAGDSDPHDVLISELGQAARIWPDLEPLLSEATPARLSLTTRQAWSFLGEYRPLLEESGCIVAVPSWWGGQDNTLGLRMIIESPDLDDIDGPPRGLAATIRYRWQVAVGDQPLSLEALRRLRDQQTPLVQVDGRWIEVDQDQLARAIELLERHESMEASLLEAMRLASESTEEETGLAILGLEAHGWVGGLLEGPSDEGVTALPQPAPFKGTLRPYQRAGLNWLGFLDRYGLGGCLADDMGLGKTVQLIALLQHERARTDPIGPTLLVVPTSVVGNWQRELGRFAPELTSHVQHGPDRPMAGAFVEAAMGTDVTITTYALVARDAETLDQVDWHRVVLDEAQYIKNPPTKQAQAIRALSATRRIALTGTPVENRLSELWSIMEFCNPGFLGAGPDFRKKFARPIERHRDAGAAASLRRLVQPFVLRRLKTDRNVISDLPECVETREYATLTPEQAALYQAVVDQMIGQVDRTEGIQRRGIILAMLARLKQICDHPALAESGESVVAAASSGDSIKRLSERSGKSGRLCQLLEEVLAAGERALVFTQYRRMGRLLSAMIEHDLGCRSLFLHGGTPMAKRQTMIDSFQDESSDTPVFVLSLKAGGLGLNLTAANHVFHFDRWWNPAVEKQATDRAFRIGQTRTVHVHKFVCMGTLEERIDRMIEEKTQLAEQIIGSGDEWLTELTTGQLRDMLMLRSSAMEVEA